jgi:hypothetical protein
LLPYLDEALPAHVLVTSSASIFSEYAHQPIATRHHHSNATIASHQFSSNSVAIFIDASVRFAEDVSAPAAEVCLLISIGNVVFIVYSYLLSRQIVLLSIRFSILEIFHGVLQIST